MSKSTKTTVEFEYDEQGRLKKEVKTVTETDTPGLFQYPYKPSEYQPRWYYNGPWYPATLYNSSDSLVSGLSFVSSAGKSTSGTEKSTGGYL